MIGCILHVNARGSLGVYYIYIYGVARQGRRTECGRAVRESVCVERLEFVGVESESCWE